MSADAELAEVLDWLWRTTPPQAAHDKARASLLDTVGRVIPAAAPEAVRAKPREILLATVGCVIAAGAKEPLQHLAEAIRVTDPGAVSVPGFAQRLSGGGAAAPGACRSAQRSPRWRSCAGRVSRTCLLH